MIHHAVSEVAVEVAPNLPTGIKRGLLEKAAASTWSARSVIRAMVVDDPEAYAHLLSIPRLETYRFSALETLPGSNWADCVGVAADAGFSIEEIVAASGPMSHSWMGSESEMLSSRQELYESFLDHPDARIVEVAARLAESAGMRRHRAEQREREEAIWGRRE